MINVALLGFGTVGTGVAEVLTMNRELIAQRVGQQVELKYILHLLAQGVRTAEAEVVSEAVPVDAASVEPGIALYFIQPGESAWDVAKRYRVPLSELQQLNPELPDQPRPGTPVIAYRR